MRMKWSTKLSLGPFVCKNVDENEVLDRIVSRAILENR
jgi:hypothetical protein